MDIESLNKSSSTISSSTISGKAYAVEMKERANGIKELAMNSKNESAQMTASLEEVLRTSMESSKNVNSIQNLTDEILSIVQNMAEASGKLLDFVNTNVLEDYDQFVLASVKYLNDADTMESMMSEFYDKSAELSEGSRNVSSGIDRVSQAIGDENTKVSSLSEIMQELSANMEKIQDCTAVNDGVSNDLKKEIARFKAI